MGANSSSEGGDNLLGFCEPKPYVHMLDANEEEEEDYLENGAELSDYVMPLEYLDYYWKPQTHLQQPLSPRVPEVENIFAYDEPELVQLEYEIVERLMDHARLGECI
jgi:hypothetical protein